MKPFTKRPQIDEMIPHLITFFAECKGALERLCLESGLSPRDLYQDLNQPDIQAGILDFLLNNESLLVQFSHQQGFNPAEIWQLRQTLPGALPIL